MYTADATAPVRGARGLRRLLDELGFKQAEIHLNEWNYLPNNDWGPMLSRNGAALEQWFAEAGGPRGAAFAACVLLGLEDAPIEMANFYTGDNGAWGLFSTYGVPKKTYHAFRAFKALLDHPARLAVEGNRPGGLAAAAGIAADGRELAVLLSNYRPGDRRMEVTVENLPWTGPSECELLVLDAARNLEPLPAQSAHGPRIQLVQDLPAPGVLLIHVRSAGR
jgi:hypothetical protein